MRICLDFDGVLHDPYNRDEGYRMGKPVPGAIDALRWLKMFGHDLVLHTARVRELEHRDHVVRWLAWAGMDRYIDSIHIAKPVADLYIDDKAIRFVDWPQAMADISRVLPLDRASGSTPC